MWESKSFHTSFLPHSLSLALSGSPSGPTPSVPSSPLRSLIWSLQDINARTRVRARNCCDYFFFYFIKNLILYL
nr:MAG TPA: hypothetical protein [Caudoviricetes sp.]